MQFENLELDYVDFETAVSLTEKGCFLKTKKSYVKHNDDTISTINNIGLPPNMYPRPELELVSKWLMEKKDINITICILKKEYGSAWYYNIDRINEMILLHRWHPIDETYDSYEKALSEGIKLSLTYI